MDISGQKPNEIEVVGTYGAAHAKQVVTAAIADYREAAGERRSQG